MRGAVLNLWNSTLWNLAPIRLTARAVGAGLNLVTARELVTALVSADLGPALVATAWLVPWVKVVLLACRLVRGGSGGRAPGADGLRFARPFRRPGAHRLRAWPRRGRRSCGRRATGSRRSASSSSKR